MHMQRGRNACLAAQACVVCLQAWDISSAADPTRGRMLGMFQLRYVQLHLELAAPGDAGPSVPTHCPQVHAAGASTSV